jgi:hypothetical protein
MTRENYRPRVSKPYICTVAVARNDMGLYSCPPSRSKNFDVASRLLENVCRLRCRLCTIVYGFIMNGLGLSRPTHSSAPHV